MKKNYYWGFCVGILSACLITIMVKWATPHSNPPETNEWKHAWSYPEVRFSVVHHHVLLMLTNHPYVSFGGATIVNMTDAEWATITNLHGAVVFTNDLEFYQ